MNFNNFSSYLSKIEKTSLRNQMTIILADLFAKSSVDEIDKVCCLALGQLAPKYEGIEFNMAEKIMMKAVSRSLNIEEKKIIEEYKKSGDLGETILKFKTPHFASASLRFRGASQGKQNLKLSVEEVYKKLLEIAQEKGEGSVERKINKMAVLLTKIDSLSAKYLVRMPLGKLRLGFSDMTILDALSWMKKKDKSLRPGLERAFNVLADIGKIAKTFKTKGIKGIKEIKSEVGVPIRAAKAERLPSAEKILEKMENQCVLEPKYDGFRVQIHIDKLKTKNEKRKTKNENLNLFEEQKENIFVRIFSRNLENTTYMFPDVVEAAQKLKVKSAILDGEAIAFNPKTSKFLPFQETVQRKRKHGVSEKAKEVPLKVFVFDLLYLNGEPLLTKPFKERRRLLEEVLEKSRGEEKGVILTKQKIVKKPEEFDKFFKKIVNEGLEGLMAKKLDAVYRAGARDFTWVKYKAGMKSDLADTVDCVVMGYYRGKGKRSVFGIGAFLAGVIKKSKIKNQKSKIHIKNKKEQNLKIEDFEGYVSVSKVGTGLTDNQWRDIYKRCEKLKIKEKPEEYVVDKNLFPDVWCRPELVVEIEADTITKSPIHTANLALRFPRLKRFRDDKNPDQATSLEELKSLAN